MERDPYLEVARRFFNEFLELKVQIDQGLVVPGQLEKIQQRHDKERRKWEQGNKELKITAEGLAKEVDRLEHDLETALSENESLKAQLNEAKIRGRLNERMDEVLKYPLEEHMSERAFKEWRKIMQELPRSKGDD